ncbi:MAG TPA: RNA polymerase sigma factor [Actinomycetota bacterium]|nr:RNA polymerase sigma factor [Actinomycetota bacterium]
MELEDVFRTHQSSVYVYFLRMVGDVAEAEELTQETFYRACLSALRFRGESNVRTWLFGIARHVFLERLRRTGRERPVRDVLDTPLHPSDPSERLSLEQAFAALRTADREVLMLVDVLGFEVGEAAVALDVTPGALRTRLHRARRRMRAELSL